MVSFIKNHRGEHGGGSLNTKPLPKPPTEGLSVFPAITAAKLRTFIDEQSQSSHQPINPPPHPNTVLSLPSPTPLPTPLPTPCDSAVPECPGLWEPWSGLTAACGPPNTSLPTSLWSFLAVTRSPEVREYQLRLSHISDCPFPPPERCLRASLEPSTHPSAV